jgi:hypothetical protein
MFIVQFVILSILLTLQYINSGNLRSTVYNRFFYKGSRSIFIIWIRIQIRVQGVDDKNVQVFLSFDQKLPPLRISKLQAEPPDPQKTASFPTNQIYLFVIFCR